MSLDAMDWVWEHSKSKGVARLLLLALADKALPAQDECKAYGSYRWLAKRGNCTQGAVQEALESLYAIGELELLTEKGPNGAAAYRLPGAVGYSRPNRSAQRSDSKSNPEANRSAQPSTRSLGSVERSEAKSLGSAEHNTNHPPRPTTTSTPDPSATQAPGGGGGRYAAEAEFLQNLPAPWVIGPVTAEKLAPLLAEARTARGWNLDTDLARQLTRNPQRVKDYGAVLPTRIADLPKRPTTRTQPRASPQTARQLPQWCGHIDCDEITRTRTTIGADGLNHTVACPACHPHHQEAA